MMPLSICYEVSSDFGDLILRKPAELKNILLPVASAPKLFPTPETSFTEAVLDQVNEVDSVPPVKKLRLGPDPGPEI